MKDATLAMMFVGEQASGDNIGLDEASGLPMTAWISRLSVCVLGGSRARGTISGGEVDDSGLGSAGLCLFGRE